VDQQQQTPQWSPPPQQPAGWGTGGMAPADRPLGVTLSAIWFYFIGVLALLGAVLLIAGTQMLESVFGGGVFASLGIVLAFIVGLVGVLLILTGWGVWTLTGQDGLVSGVIQIAIWGGVIYALWMAKAWFSAR
jgi:hypothetical protein